MADYTTLNIINKLLLEKLEQLEKDNKELKNNYELLEIKEKRNYNELYSLKNCVCMEDCERCYECVGNMWYDYRDLYSVGDDFVCDNCWNDKGYFECDGCCEPYNDEEHNIITDKIFCDNLEFCDKWDFCENCYDKEIKKRYKKVMAELLLQ